MHAFGWQLPVGWQTKGCFCEHYPIAIAAKSDFLKEKMVMLASCVPIVFFYFESFYEPFLGVKIQKKPNKSCPMHYIDGMGMWG